VHRDAAAVGERHDHHGIREEVPQAVASELELVVPHDRTRLEDRVRGRAKVVAEAGQRHLRCRGVAANGRGALEHEHAQPRAGEVCGGDETVVPGAGNDDVEAGHWRRSRIQSAIAGRYL
jgi:hypothetical protein